MKKLRLFTILLIFFMIIGIADIAAHGSIDSQQIQAFFASDINGVLTVHNHSNKDLVLISGDIISENILGGIWANSSRNFDISRIPGIIARGSLIVHAVDFDKYVSTQGRLMNRDILWTDSFSYNLIDLGNKPVLTIFIMDEALIAPEDIPEPLVIVSSVDNQKSVEIQYPIVLFADDEYGTLTVFNNTDTDLVLFAGNVIRGNVLGGIQANTSRNFNIAKIAGLPYKGVFIIRGVSFNAFQNKRGNVTFEDVIWTELFSYNLSDSFYLYIDKLLTGSHSFIVSNESPYILSLFIDSFNGSYSAYIPPFTMNAVININIDDYTYIYPDYVYYNTGLDTIAWNCITDQSMQHTVIQIINNMSSLVFTNEQFAPNTGFLFINNNTNETAFLHDGDISILNIDSGKSDFCVMHSNSGGLLYSNLNIEFNGGNMDLDNILIMPGYMYFINLYRIGNSYLYDIRQENNWNENMSVQLLFE